MSTRKLKAWGWGASLCTQREGATIWQQWCTSSDPPTPLLRRCHNCVLACEYMGARCAMGHYCNDLDRHAASCWVNTVGLHADMERFRWVLMEKQGHRAECIRPKLIWVHTCHTRKLCRGGSGNQGDAQGLNLQHTYSLLEKKSQAPPVPAA